MEITIPMEIEQAFRNKAAASGFRTVEEYVLNLVVADVTQKPAVSDALRQLRHLRQQVPHMTTQEIVSLATEGRDR